EASLTSEDLESIDRRRAGGGGHAVTGDDDGFDTPSDHNLCEIVQNIVDDRLIGFGGNDLTDLLIDMAENLPVGLDEKGLDPALHGGVAKLVDVLLAESLALGLAITFDHGFEPFEVTGPKIFQERSRRSSSLMASG